jgi:hypothetical protein
MRSVRAVGKRFSHGLQLLASYTWASALETNPGYTTGAFAGGARLGDQNSARANYGLDNFIRPQRFVVSHVYELSGFWIASIANPSFHGSYVAPIAAMDALFVACAHIQPDRSLAALRQKDQDSRSRWYSPLPEEEFRKRNNRKEDERGPSRPSKESSLSAGGGIAGIPKGNGAHER